MRLNGNHLDRLIYSILPLGISIGTLVYLINPKKNVILASIITVFAYWTIDTIILRFKRPKTLKINNGQLFVGEQLVELSDIESITPMSDNRARWSFELVKIRTSQLGEFNIIDRPFPFWYFGDRSKVVDILVSNFPILENKVKSRHSF